MAGEKKIALMGFSDVNFHPVVSNTTESYEVGEKLPMPWATEMTKEPDTNETKIYGDDILYLEIKAWNGLKSTITLIEMPLDKFQTLGFGTYDVATKVLDWNPQSENKEFAVTFRCLQAGGEYRMYKMFSFTVNELKDSGIKTKGDNTQVNTYQLVGTFTPRKIDNLPGQMHDGSDLTWLDTIETVTS